MEILSKDIPHVRIDLYNIQGKVYFGEFTFHHNGGAVPFYPAEWDERIGDLFTFSGSEADLDYLSKLTVDTLPPFGWEKHLKI